MRSRELAEASAVPAARGPATSTEEQSEGSLTTRDLIRAPIARAQKTDVSAISDDARWEPIVAALLAPRPLSFSRTPRFR